MAGAADDDDIVFKIITIGDTGVGKSCLLKSYMGDPFKNVYTSTIGVDFEIKPIQLHGTPINLQIWDTAGQERFRTITTSYYRSADAILLVFDLTDEKTFQNLEAWLEDVRMYSQRDADIVLIGNKCDLGDARAVDYEEAKAYADKFHFSYFETSAKTRINVEKAFATLTQSVYDRKIAAAVAAAAASTVGHGPPAIASSSPSSASSTLGATNAAALASSSAASSSAATGNRIKVTANNAPNGSSSKSSSQVSLCC